MAALFLILFIVFNTKQRGFIKYEPSNQYMHFWVAAALIFLWVMATGLIQSSDYNKHNAVLHDLINYP